MSLKHAIRAATGLALAFVGTGATLAYFEESIPMSLNPLYAKTMADYRAQELIFDRLWFNDAITNELRSRVVQKYQVAEAGRAVEAPGGFEWKRSPRDRKIPGFMERKEGARTDGHLRHAKQHHFRTDHAGSPRHLRRTEA